jgi:hypothetical protein
LGPAPDCPPDAAAAEPPGGPPGCPSADGLLSPAPEPPTASGGFDSPPPCLGGAASAGGLVSVAVAALSPTGEAPGPSLTDFGAVLRRVRFFDAVFDDACSTSPSVLVFAMAAAPSRAQRA